MKHCLEVLKKMTAYPESQTKPVLSMKCQFTDYQFGCCTISIVLRRTIRQEITTANNSAAWLMKRMQCAVTRIFDNDSHKNRYDRSQTPESMTAHTTLITEQ
jgi:hypothetical protein